MMAMSWKENCISICAPAPSCELGWFASPCICQTQVTPLSAEAQAAPSPAAARSRRGRGMEE